VNHDNGLPGHGFLTGSHKVGCIVERLDYSIAIQFSHVLALVIAIGDEEHRTARRPRAAGIMARIADMQIERWRGAQSFAGMQQG
jgi:hypothetical protein